MAVDGALVIAGCWWSGQELASLAEQIRRLPQVGVGVLEGQEVVNRPAQLVGDGATRIINRHGFPSGVRHHARYVRGTQDA
jgi:hypothetical protein